VLTSLQYLMSIEAPLSTRYSMFNVTIFEFIVIIEHFLDIKQSEQERKLVPWWKGQMPWNLPTIAFRWLNM